MPAGIAPIRKKLLHWSTGSAWERDKVSETAVRVLAKVALIRANNTNVDTNVAGMGRDKCQTRLSEPELAVFGVRVALAQE